MIPQYLERVVYFLADESNRAKVNWTQGTNRSQFMASIGNLAIAIEQGYNDNEIPYLSLTLFNEKGEIAEEYMVDARRSSSESKLLTRIFDIARRRVRRVEEVVTMMEKELGIDPKATLPTDSTNSADKTMEDDLPF